jgi:hypothetical protein
MDKAQQLATWIPIAFAVPGVIGGWITVVEKFKERRKLRFPPGLRGVQAQFFRLEKGQNGEFICDVLALGDLLQIMQLLIEKPKGRLDYLQQVGEYYHFKIAFPPGIDPTKLQIVVQKAPAAKSKWPWSRRDRGSV